MAIFAISTNATSCAGVAAAGFTAGMDGRSAGGGWSAAPTMRIPRPSIPIPIRTRRLLWWSRQRHRRSSFRHRHLHRLRSSSRHRRPRLRWPRLRRRQRHLQRRPWPQLRPVSRERGTTATHLRAITLTFRSAKCSGARFPHRHHHRASTSGVHPEVHPPIGHADDVTRNAQVDHHRSVAREKLVDRRRELVERARAAAVASEVSSDTGEVR